MTTWTWTWRWRAEKHRALNAPIWTLVGPRLKTVHRYSTDNVVWQTVPTVDDPVTEEMLTDTQMTSRLVQCVPVTPQFVQAFSDREELSTVNVFPVRYDFECLY